MSWIEALIIAIVEGITEFLPISSTGHMIITEKVLGLKSDEFVKLFIVSIQLGAILSVVVLYWKRFLKTLKFYYILFVAFLPAAIFGLLLGKYIDYLLDSVIVVAISLIAGGIFLLFTDKLFKRFAEDQEVGYKKGFFIGLFQVIAMIPGVSRSAATIIGGMAQKLTRKTAAEFSFFLAVPTMLAATGYKLYENKELLNSENIDILLFGNAVAFVVAILAIKFFIHFLTKYGFKLFGWYRIAIGALILILLLSGTGLQVN
jgi:undecaprenyl-diphosphatase